MKKAAAVIYGMAGGLTIALLCASPPTVWAEERQVAAQGPPPVPETATEPQGFIAEPNAVFRAALFADRNLAKGEPSDGFHVETGNMITGSGWIAVGPGYSHWYANDRVLVDASAGISWRGYKMAQVSVELPRIARSRLALGSQFRWQDLGQVAYFGEGAETSLDDHSEYRLKSNNLVGYATLRPVKWLGIGAAVGWLKPAIAPRAGTFLRPLPNAFEAFPNDIVFALPDQPTFVQSTVSITADTRDFPGHPTRGGLVRAAAATYADRNRGVFSFKRYEGEVAGFVPLAGARVVLAVRGLLVASETAEGQSVPFYLQPSLGGHNTLRGYHDYRFHDRNMVVLNAETRLAMMTHVDAALFYDAGNVAASVGDLDFDKRSYGVGLRLHSRRQTYARLDLGRSTEGWRFFFRLTDPLNLSRLSRRTTPVPFVP